MPWNPDVPQPFDLASNSQGDLLNNFASLNTWMNVDHFVAGDPNQGKHRQVLMPVLDNTQPVGANEAKLFMGLGRTFADQVHLYYKREGTAGGTIADLNLHPWTEFSDIDEDDARGFFYVAGGNLLVQYGQIGDGGVADIDIDFLMPFSSVPLVFVIPVTTLSPLTIAQLFTVDNITSDGFTTYRRTASNGGVGAPGDPLSRGFHWFAFGRS